MMTGAKLLEEVTGKHRHHDADRLPARPRSRTSSDARSSPSIGPGSAILMENGSSGSSESIDILVSDGWTILDSSESLILRIAIACDSTKETAGCYRTPSEDVPVPLAVDSSCD